MKISVPKKFKLNKTWLVLAVAMGVGLLAAFAAQNYLSDQMASLEAKSKSGQSAVVVASREMAKGERISSENVAVRNFPSDYVHSDAITPESFSQLEGQILAHGVKPGDMMIWGSLESKKAPTFSAQVEAGRRAITVPVDEINSISGMLEPGDIVDLMLSVDQKGRKITFPLLQSVQVMATGQRSVQDPQNGEQRQYSTVTLNTTPHDAQVLIAARDSGKITALLRNPQDKNAISNTINASALPGTGDSERQVPVIYGGGKISAEGLNLRLPAAAAPEALRETTAVPPTKQIDSAPVTGTAISGSKLQ